MHHLQLCLEIFPLHAREYCQISEGFGYLWIRRPEPLFLDAQGPLAERLRFGIVSLYVVQIRLTIQHRNELRMVRSQRLFLHVQGAFIQWTRFTILSLLSVEFC